MVGYRLQIALNGSLRDKQLWTSAKKTQEVLAFNGLRDLKNAWYIALANFSFVELRYLTASHTNMTSLAPYTLAHFILALKTYQPSPDDPTLRYTPQPRNFWTLDDSTPELYRGPWHAYEQAKDEAQEEAKAQQEAKNLTFVCAYGIHQGDTLELEPDPYSRDDIPTFDVPGARREHNCSSPTTGWFSTAWWISTKGERHAALHRPGHHARLYP